MDQRMINYIGWLGHQNLGDEALFLAIQKIFYHSQLVPYHWNLLSRISIFGGGTILPPHPTQRLRVFKSRARFKMTIYKHISEVEAKRRSKKDAKMQTQKIDKTEKDSIEERLRSLGYL